MILSISLANLVFSPPYPPLLKSIKSKEEKETY
jgi:hypothetical protein